MKRETTSASNIFRRELCLGSHHAEAQFPEEEDSEQAAEGTLLHELDADPKKDRSGLKGEQSDLLKSSALMDEDIFLQLVRSEMVGADEAFDEGRELGLWLRKGIKPVFPGHCDRWRYYPESKVLAIIDKKFGFLPVTPADANMQLRAYAVMGAAKWDADHVVVAITQPRLPFDERVSVAEYKRNDIPAARDHLLRVWSASREDGAPRVAGEEQCRYCRARLHCDAYRAKYQWLAGPAENGKDAYIERLAELTDDELDSVWRAIAFAKLVESPAKDEIKRRHESGGMPMYNLKDSGKMAKINDAAKARDLLIDSGIIDASEVDDCATYGLERLSEKVRLKEGCTMKAAKIKIRDTLEPVLSIIPKSPSLKRINDWAPQVEDSQQPSLL